MNAPDLEYICNVQDMHKNKLYSNINLLCFENTSLSIMYYFSFYLFNHYH